MSNLVCAILAAGEGRRMKSERPKVLHEIFGRPMLDYLLESVRSAGIKKVIIVVGHRAEEVKKFLSQKQSQFKHFEIEAVLQKKPLGSGDAVSQLKKSFSHQDADLLILYADTPLISRYTIETIIKQHEKSQAACTLLCAILKNPTGYGRIVRNDDGKIVKIVEELDATVYEKAIEEVNVGVYFFKAKDLFSALEEIKPENAKAEYYLTDCIAILTKKGKRVESLALENTKEILGVNTRADLACALSNLNLKNVEKWLSEGVSILSPGQTFIADNVRIGQDSVIYPFTLIEEDVVIGKNCLIGPFVHLRSGTVLEDGVEVGNFAEIVRSRVGRKSKVKHQSYLGDSSLGQGVNIGAGTIVANFDGCQKHRSDIADGAFIGSGTVLVSPVKIGKKAITGAGCVVTKNKNVPAGKIVVGIPAKILEKKKNKRIAKHRG